MKILGFGEVLWDVFETDAHIGGAVFNLVAHMAQCGAQVELVSRVGCDEWGDRAFAEMDRLGVGRRWATRDDPHPTGTVDVTVADGGQPTFQIHTDVAYDHISLSDAAADEIVAGDFDAVCFGTLAQRGSTSRRTLHALLERLHDSRLRRFCDINLRPDCFTRDTVEYSLRAANIVKLNHEEVAVLGEMFFSRPLGDEEFSARVCERYDPEIVVVTRGARGCAVYDRQSFLELPGRRVDVVNTVGSGDAFSAVFVRTYLSTGDVAAAATVANELGAFVATQPMAVPEYPEALRETLGID